MDGTASEKEARYTLHLRTRGIDASGLTLAEDGTVPSAPTRGAAAMPAGVDLPTIELREGDAELAVLQTLGVGGMGKVLLALQRPLQREVAVKVPRDEAATPQVTAELMREALVTGRLEHPNIVPVHLLARGRDGAPFFVMKRIEGTVWRTLLDDPDELAAFGARALDPLGFHLGVLLEVCDAVAFAHSRGVLHRDLKPDNVMLGRFGEVYVLDWGLAVTTGDDPLLTRARDSHGLCGTPAYMAPELAAGDGAQLSERTDVYLLGAMLHHVLTGRPPHDGTTIIQTLTAAWESSAPEFTANVPDELASVCRRAMARAPDDRPGSVHVFRDALEAYLRRRDAHALAAEAERRLQMLEAALALARTGAPTPPLALQVAFTECRFAFRQVKDVPGLEATAQRGLERAVVAMAHGEVLAENLVAARAHAAELASVPPDLAEALTALEQTLEGRKARVAALEQLELETDLDAAVALRSRVALTVAVVCSVGMLGIAVLKRLGLMPFGFREAVVGMGVFAAGIVLAELVIRRRSRLNDAQRRLLRGNHVALASFVTFWAGAWWLGLGFEQAAVGFMFYVAVNWWIASALFDKRAWPVAAAFSTATVLAALVRDWQFEVFSGATLLGFGGLATTWGRSRFSTGRNPDQR
jgi:serine/threonine-protein kinase